MVDSRLDELMLRVTERRMKDTKLNLRIRPEVPDPCPPDELIIVPDAPTDKARVYFGGLAVTMTGLQLAMFILGTVASAVQRRTDDESPNAASS